MPVERRLQVLEARIRRDYGDSFAIEVTDLYGLSPADRNAALDAMIEAQGDFPVVLVDGVAACVGDIDADAIVAVVGRSLAG